MGLAESVYTWTDRLGWTDGNAQKIKNDRAGKTPISLYKTVRGPDQSGAWYNIAHWVGKFFTPFIPGGGAVGAIGSGAKAASKSGGFVNKVIRGALGSVLGSAPKRVAPKEPTRLTPRVTPPSTGASAGLSRRTSNTGDFAALPVPMQKRVVRSTARQADVGLGGAKIKINRDVGLIGRQLYGHTSPDGTNYLVSGCVLLKGEPGPDDRARAHARHAASGIWQAEVT